MILGREARHLWTPSGASSVQARLNYRKDDGGNRVSPVVKIKTVGGLAALGESSGSNDPRVGHDGEIPRPGRRRGKTLTYQGTVRADSLRGLRLFQSQLREAFADRSNEGRMVHDPHPLNPEFSPDDSRYFDARVLSLDMDDIVSSQFYEATFVLGLRMSDARYFQDADGEEAVIVNTNTTYTFA